MELQGKDLFIEATAIIFGTLGGLACIIIATIHYFG